MSEKTGMVEWGSGAVELEELDELGNVGSADLGGDGVDGQFGIATASIVDEDEMEADAVVTPANHFGIDGEGMRSFQLPLVSECDANDGAEIPSLAGVNVEARSADVAHAMRCGGPAGKEVSDKTRKCFTLGVARVRWLFVKEALQQAFWLLAVAGNDC